jgi:GNAT superfamily N-acetyltransferase
MPLTLRKYHHEDDYWHIRSFLRQVFLLNNRRELSWQVARFDYWRWHSVLNLNDGSLEDVSLWETEEGQIAAVLNPEGLGEAHFSLHPAFYTPELAAEMVMRTEDSLAVASPDGQKKLTVWVDDVTRSAYFEPIATVPAHQRRGLGKAVMCEGLRRLKRMGATKAFVGSYSPEAHALYASIGFTEYELLESWNTIL